ncbi:unnamed protein product [Ceutorhynchus assimilis]|uniref:HEAT repeat-containing protein 1 n=1 Tax=Ceutorhynchus assimilis TaxID=467358 RepID=A0A9N9MPH9_9CUCU|nr:unnamed protein product [Ceutorhynchus assimilis]
MSTSLATQLQNLAVPASSVFKNDKKRTTLLFDPKEAAAISGEVIYEIGLEGLEQLILKNEDFEQFKLSLFHGSSKDFDRNVQSKEDNSKVNKTVKKFLALLAPYVLLNPAHKALEWLFHRYTINEHNRQDLIMAFLPYYNSNIFSRLIQTLKFKDTNDPFCFLKTVQKSGMHLQRLDLFYQALSNGSIMKYLTKFMNQVISAHSKNYNALATLFNFYSTVFCGAIEFANELTEPFITQMLPLLLKGLNSPIPDFTAASYVITARLLSKGQLTDKLLNTFVEKVSELSCSSLKLEATLLLVLIYQLQKQYENLPQEALINLAKTSWVVECLGYLHENGNCVYGFLKVLLQKAICGGVQKDEALCRKLVAELVEVIEFDGEFLRMFLCFLLNTVDETTIQNHQLNNWLCLVVKNLESKSSSTLDLAVSDLLKDKTTTPSKKAIAKLIFGKVSDSYATKFKILDDLYEEKGPVKAEMLKSIAGLIGKLKPSDQYLFSNVLCEKLGSEDPIVVESTLELINSADIADMHLIKMSFVELFKSDKLPKKEWQKSYILATKFLLKQEEFNWETFILIFPVLMFYNKKELFKLKFFNNTLFENFNKNKDDIVELLKHINTKTTKEIFEKIPLDPEANRINQYSSIIIMSHIIPDITCLNQTIFNIFGNLLKPNNDKSLLEKALGKIVSLKQCLQLIIMKLVDKNLDWATMDFISNNKYTLLVSQLSVLAFSNNGSKIESVFNKFLNHISSDMALKRNVSLNVCVSGIISEAIVINLMKFTQDKLVDETSDKITFQYLLALLNNPSKNIRIQAFDLAESLLKQSKNTFLRDLLKYKEEIIVDHQQMALTCHSLMGIKNSSVLADLLKATCSKDIPIYTKANIVKVLTHINSYEMCEKFCKHFLELFANKLQFNELETEIITNLIDRFDLKIMPQTTLTSSIWKFVNFVLKTNKIVTINSEKVYLPNILLNQLSKDIYGVLREDVLEKLLDIICEIAVLSEDPEAVSSANKIFKHMDLNAKLISNLLKNMAEVQSIRASSTKRRINVVPTADILDTMQWKKGICALEFIQGKKKIRNGHCLLPLLFDILKKCLDFEEQAAVEYPKQLTLSLILLVCTKLEDEEISEKDFNIELVIQCIRASQNPQTHYHALLALAHAAKFVPNEVLHHVMAVFTFMGSTLIRHDDAYSFEIISKIVDTIVPILVSGNQISKIVDVLRVFVGALLDVPEHRRIPLYSKLLNNINTKANFHLFLLLVLEAEVFQSAREKKKIEKGSTSQRIKIALNLCQEFSPEITLRACVLLSKYVNELPDEKDDVTMRTDKVLINLSNYNAKQFRHYKYIIITFLSNLLSSKIFVNKVSVLTNTENIQMEPLYKELIINVLAYIQRIQKICDKSATGPQSLYWKTVLYHSYDLLDSVNDLLTPHMFLLVINGLLAHSILTVKKRALELLNNKLQYNLNGFSINDTNELCILIKPIILIIEFIEQDNLQGDQETLIQTALLSLKLIVKTLGPEDPEKFVQILDFVASILNSGKAKDNVLASVILCLAELCIVLRGHGISSLNSFMPAFLRILKSQKHQETTSMLLLSVVTTINKLLDSFAAFLSPYLTKLICETSILMSKWNCLEDDPKSQALVTRLNGIKKKLSVAIPARILIPTIEECYNVLSAKKYYNALVALADIMEEQLGSLQFSDISPNMNELNKFFFKTLQFRCDSDVSLEIANLVEDKAVKTLTVFILKLSESTFRPFYLKLYDWAVRNNTKNPERLITFYHLSEYIGQSLKGLFVLFAGNILNNLAEILRTINSQKQYFEDQNKTLLLLKFVLKTLQVIFTYDNKKLMNRDRFELLMQPLVDLLENYNIDGNMAELVKRNEQLITPTIVQFSLAVADDALWKEMNYQILLKMRNPNPDIRLIALHCLTEVVAKLREDFLPLLPETIPFLAELLEDEDERVEKSCQKAIREMEKVLGEPLQKYF